MKPARKRILYCEGNTDSSVGGSYYSLFYLVESLDKTLYEPVVVFHREHRLLPMYRQAGLDSRVFPYRDAARFAAQASRFGFAGRFLKLAQNFVNIWRMVIFPGIRCALYLRANHIDLVHLNNTVVRNHHWMLGAVLARVKCITHERGIEYIPRFSRFFVGKLSAVICISGCVQENLFKQGIAAKQLIVIHNGLDPDRVRAKADAAEIRQRHGIEPGSPIIGIIGNIKEWKGQDVVVRATARLRQRWPNIRCLLVGDTEVDRVYEEHLRKQVVEQGLENNVIFTGYQPNVADYLNVMDVMIHASVLPEPFGRVLLEGMAMKKPVIGARGGAVPEIIVHGESGFMFKPGDDAELAQYVAGLLEDSSRAREMGEMGHKRAGQEFGIQKNVQKTQQLYASLFT